MHNYSAFEVSFYISHLLILYVKIPCNAPLILIPIDRALDKREYLMIIFLISDRNHMM